MIRCVGTSLLLAFLAAVAQGQISRPWAEPACVTQSPARAFERAWQQVAGQAAAAEALLREGQDGSGEVTGYRCRFERWEYDATWGPKDAARTYATGVIQCERSGIGLLRMNWLAFYKPPPRGQGEPSYDVRIGEPLDHFVWSREAFWQVLPEHKIVREYRGERPEVNLLLARVLVRAPTLAAELPLQIGLRAPSLQEAYIQRDITPKGAMQRWIELSPKSAGDRAIYRSIEVILDAKSGFPSAVQFHFHPRNRTVFTFSELELSPQMPILPPPLPEGWRREGLGQSP